MWTSKSVSGAWRCPVLTGSAWSSCLALSVGQKRRLSRGRALGPWCLPWGQAGLSGLLPAALRSQATSRCWPGLRAAAPCRPEVPWPALQHRSLHRARPSRDRPWGTQCTATSAWPAGGRGQTLWSSAQGEGEPQSCRVSPGMGSHTEAAPRHGSFLVSTECVGCLLAGTWLRGETAGGGWADTWEGQEASGGGDLAVQSRTRNESEA